MLTSSPGTTTVLVSRLCPCPAIVSCLSRLRVAGYFRGQDVSGKSEIVVPVYERAAPVDEPAPAPPASTADSEKGAAYASFRFPFSSFPELSLLLLSLFACLLYVNLPPLGLRVALP